MLDVTIKIGSDTEIPNNQTAVSKTLVHKAHSTHEAQAMAPTYYQAMDQSAHAAVYPCDQISINDALEAAQVSLKGKVNVGMLNGAFVAPSLPTDRRSDPPSTSRSNRIINPDRHISLDIVICNCLSGARQKAAIL